MITSCLVRGVSRTLWGGDRMMAVGGKPRNLEKNLSVRPSRLLILSHTKLNLGLQGRSQRLAASFGCQVEYRIVFEGSGFLI